MKKNSQARYLLFTDLDGTLLDHHTYSFQPALETIRSLIAKQIPWILNTSKTLAEVITLRQKLAQTHPVIVENGAGIAIPVRYFAQLSEVLPEKEGLLLKEMGTSREKILTVLQKLRENSDYLFEGFHDWEVDELIEKTGLDRDSARKARERFFSEPIQWQGTAAAKQDFLRELKENHLFGLQGGRFLHIMGDINKGKTALWLQQQYQREWRHSLQTIGLGDSANDIALLEVVDFPCIVRSPVHPPPQLQTNKEVRISSSFGPAGWHELVSEIFQLPH